MTRRWGRVRTSAKVVSGSMPAGWAQRGPNVRKRRATVSGAPMRPHFRPALYLHTPLQLLSARVPVQTLTEHELNYEGRAGQPS